MPYQPLTHQSNKKENNIMKHLYFYLCSALLTASFCLMSCQEDTESFNNKAFISSGQTTTLLLKGNSGIIEKTVQATIAKPTQQDIHISYKTDPSLIATYNAFYYDHAIELPEECYEIPEANAVISAGSIKSTIVSIYFKNLESLDRDLVYVLPVSISDVNMDILESGRTSYFIIKGAALINTAANISNIGLYPNLANADAMNKLEKQ